MIRRLTLPDPPRPHGDARMSSAAAVRNRAAILAEVLRLSPATGHALELASGTGEHVVAFAQSLPGLHWTPSDPDPVRRASIIAWAAPLALPNLAAPVDLDACAPGWSEGRALDLIFVSNLLHLVSASEAATCLSEIARALVPGGIALVYGPFLRDGQATSEGDAAFHDSLRAQDPDIGYKGVGWVQDRLSDAGLTPELPVAMPANNLMLVARRPG